MLTLLSGFVTGTSSGTHVLIPKLFDIYCKTASEQIYWCFWEPGFSLCEQEATNMEWGKE